MSLSFQTDTFDNYALYTGETEVVTEKEKKEDSCFLNNTLNTKPIQIAHQYLVKEGLVPSTEVIKSVSLAVL